MKKFSEFQVKALRHKYYLDLGLGLTNYAKYILILFGWASGNVKGTIYLIMAYVIFCYILGWCFVRFGWMHAQNEVTNRLNPFVEEMRKDLNNSVTTLKNGK